MKFRTHLAPFLFAVSLAVFAQDGDSTFLAAREAFRAGKIDRLEQAISQLGNHELAPYAENYRLRMWMDKGDPDGIRTFLQRNEGSYVAEKLRADWIRWLGKRALWSEVDAEYPKLLAPEPDVTCYSLQARTDRSVLAEAEKLWLTMLEPPEACRPVLDALVASQAKTADDVWTRTRRQIEANRPSQARATLNYLPDSQMPDARAFDSAINSAMSYLVKQGAGNGSRTGRELAALSLIHI